MSIRTLFSARRPIDRPIEKVIDYYATDEKRLLAEIEEYEVTAMSSGAFAHFSTRLATESVLVKSPKSACG